MDCIRQEEEEDEDAGEEDAVDIAPYSSRGEGGGHGNRGEGGI